MVVARDKTESMLFGEDATDTTTSIIALQGEPIKHVESFKYLGHLLASNPKIDTLGHKIGSAWEAWSKYRHIFTDSEIPLQIRVNILDWTV